MQKQEIKKLKKEFVIEFGKYIKKLRKEQNLTQEDLGLRCFADARKIGSLERGEYDFSFASIFIIANGLNVPPEKLLCFDASKKFMKIIQIQVPTL